MTNKKYHTVGTIPKSNIKIVERVKINFPSTQTLSHFPGLVQLFNKKWQG